MASTQKDTIYIDVDDEITSIIDKLQNSTNKIVALVLPKRASVLQSIVNMKLLKRTADNSNKHVVLITTEAGLLPLAGAVGLHVANSLNSKPAIPVAPDMVNRESVIDEETGEEFEDFNTDSAAGEPIGKLAGIGTAGAVAGASSASGAGLGAPAASTSPFKSVTEPETIELDNEDKPNTLTNADSKAPIIAGATGATKGKNKKLKIPDFNKFRLLLVAAFVALLLLGGGFIYANSALAKAVITVKTNSSDYSTKSTLTLDPKVTEFDVETATLPAKIVSKQQTGSQQVSTSGEKNNGTKSSGKISVSQVCEKRPAPVDAGSGYSAGNLTFISTQSLQLNPSGGFDSDGNIVCKGEVEVVAQQPGTKYNVAAGTKFTVAGSPGASGVNSATFTGGTDNIVKVVTQADIDSAKAKISGADSATVKDELSKMLQTDGYVAILGSLHAGEAVVTPSAAVGDQADTVTVSQSIPYSLYGARSTDIKTIITDNVKSQIDPSKQQILNDGYGKATYKVDTTAAGGPLLVLLTATSLAGPDIKIEALKSQLGGKKTGDVQAAIKNIPGVTDVTVKYSPFWVSSVPKSADKITINIVKSSASDAK